MAQRVEQETLVNVNQPEAIRFKHWKERYAFCLSLGMLLKAGVPVSKALDSISQSERRKNGRSSVAEIADSLLFRISSGMAVSRAVTFLPRAFPKHFNRLLSAAELSGDIDQVFLKLAELEELSATTKKEMAGILWYPLIVAILALLISGVALQALTSLLPFYESTGSYVVKYIQAAAAVWNTVSSPLAIGLFIGALVMFGMSFREDTIQRGLKMGLRKVWHRVPGINTLLRFSSNILFCRTLAKLLEIGVPAAQAIEPALLSANDALFDEKVRRAPGEEKSAVFHYRFLRLLGLKDIRKGEAQKDSIYSYIAGGGTISEALSIDEGLFLPQVITMTEIGQESGNFSECLESAADMLEVEFLYRSQLLKALIQPFVLTVTGLFVGLFAVLSLAPLMEVMNL